MSKGPGMFSDIGKKAKGNNMLSLSMVEIAQSLRAFYGIYVLFVPGSLIHSAACVY